MSHCTIYVGDCREALQRMPEQSVQTCVTSPPYFGLRDYGHDKQIGLEQTPDAFVAEIVCVFREVRRVLRDDGTLWLNIGDSYAGSGRGLMGDGTPSDKTGHKQATNRGTALGVFAAREVNMPPKNLIGIPWRVAFALQSDGWHLRQDIIWHKPNPMPESVTDRCTKAHEYIFLLSKSARYYYDPIAMSETRADAANGETRNRRSVWTVPTSPYKGAHFATFPPALIEPCIMAGSRAGDVVLDPFGGSGTTGAVAVGHGRNAVLCELNASYAELARERVGPMLTTIVEAAQ